MKQQFATNLEKGTIKKLKMLSAEYDIPINTILEAILNNYESDDISGKFNHDFMIYQSKK